MQTYAFAETAGAALGAEGLLYKERTIGVFSASTGIRRHFEKFVMENYKRVNSVKEFADLYYVSERSFSRKFHSSSGKVPINGCRGKGRTDVGHD